MKPFQFYLVKNFPKPAVGESLSNHVQLTFSGQTEDVVTKITLETEKFEGELDLLRIQSEIRHQTFGFIKPFIGVGREKIEFNEYLQPVDFRGYFHRTLNLMIFEAPKKTCKGIISHLKEKPCGLELSEVEVDFSKILQLNSDYIGAWFRGVSSRVQAAGLSGNQLQDDNLFKNLQKVAVMSNVTIPWECNGAVHPIMVTSRGGIVLIQNYQQIGIELQLVMDIQQKLLGKVWSERKTNNKSDGYIAGEP
jgi:hypothetical protein